MAEIFPETPITSLPDAVAFMGALPVPVGPVPQASEQDRLKAAYIVALDGAHKTHPCPVTGRPYWTGCVHYDEAGHVSGVGSCHSERRADAVLAVRDVELDRLRAQVAALLDERHSTNESVSEAAEALRVQRDRIAELETLLSAARTETVADVGDWLDEVGEKGAAYLVRTVDIPAARAMKPALSQADPEPACPCPPADQPGPHQVGCFFDGVPVSPPSERPVDGLTAAFAPVASLRELSSREEPHDSPLHRPYTTPHDLDLPEGCRLSEEQVQELGNPYLGGGA